MHSGETKFCCEICSKISKTKRGFIIHQRSHTDERPYNCDNCEKSYRETSSLNQHKKIYHGKNSKIKCDVCDRIFMSTRKLENHKLTHDPIKRMAEYKKRVSESKSFTENQKEVAYNLAKEIGIQKAASKLEMSCNTLSNWVVLKENPKKCSQCDQNFTRQAKLDKHIQAWHGEGERRSHNPCKYNKDFREEVLTFADNFGVKSASEKFDVLLSTVKDWINFAKNPLICVYCGKCYQKKRIYMEHLLKKHKEEVSDLSSEELNSFIAPHPLTQTRIYEEKVAMSETGGKLEVEEIGTSECIKKESANKKVITNGMNIEESKTIVTKTKELIDRTENKETMTYSTEKEKLITECTENEESIITASENKEYLSRGPENERTISNVTENEEPITGNESEKEESIAEAIENKEVITNGTNKSNLMKLYSKLYRKNQNETTDITELGNKYSSNLSSISSYETNKEDIYENDRESTDDSQVSEDASIDVENIKQEMKVMDSIENESSGVADRKSSIVSNKSVEIDGLIISRNPLGRLLCLFCPKTFRSPSDIKCHIVKHTGKKDYKCNICLQRFGYVRALKRHINSHGELNEECTKCGKKFPHEDNLKLHMKTHDITGSFICSFCSKLFKRKQHLTTHEKKHTGEKPFKCEFCDERFTEMRSLKAHTLKDHKSLNQVVLPQKQSICETCGKSFRTKSKLKDHMDIHSGSKQHKCLQCEAQFYVKSALGAHMLRHKVNYSCNVCDKSFSDRGNLRKHKISQHSESYPCLRCKFRAGAPSDLRLHEKSKHCNVRHECDICKVSFKWSGTLKRHKEERHS